MTKTIEIQTGVPIPRQGKHPILMLLESVEVGDSFLLDEDDRNIYSTLAAGVQNFTDRRFKSSKKEQPAGKFRVWRIA